MLGSTSGLVVSSSEAAGVSSAYEVVGLGSSSITSGGDGEFYEGDRSTGGNRWPRQETLALLKIRSDMDAVFRDSSIKGPLWDQVSRQMAELGYHRSSKKCKEKFENVYKYHKRTKDGRVGKSDGKTYRFFDQLEALEQHQLTVSPLGTPRGQQSHSAAHAAVPVTMVIPANVTVAASIVHTPQVHAQHPMINVVHTSPQGQHRPMAGQPGSPIQIGQESSPSATPSSSSLSGSDEEVAGRSRRRKRKWKEFFKRLTKEVIYKQEELQNKFLDAVERRDRDRFVREEAWRAQEVVRLSREHEILVQERSMAAAKDAALMAFLQKLSDQQQIPLPSPIKIQTQTQTQTRGSGVPVVTTIVTPATQPAPPPQPQATRVQENPVSMAIPVAIAPVQAAPVLQQPQPLSQIPPVEYHKPNSTAADNQMQASPSRWPKTEVEALINLRTELDEKYQENGPKGPLWEEISSLMKNLGYNRNAKRCKEKWENINKYFKKVKESNKRRPEDSKTCPYFHQLDSLYRGKTPKTDINTTTSTTTHPNIFNTNPIMARPEQQWPSQDHLHRIGVEEDGSEDDDSDDDASGDGDDEDDEEGTDGYEIVANNNNTTTTSTKATTE